MLLSDNSPPLWSMNQFRTSHIVKADVQNKNSQHYLDIPPDGRNNTHTLTIMNTTYLATISSSIMSGSKQAPQVCAIRAPSYFPKRNKYRLRRFYSRRIKKHSRSKRACAPTDAATLSSLHEAIRIFDCEASLSHGFIQGYDDDDYDTDSEVFSYTGKTFDLNSKKTTSIQYLVDRLSDEDRTSIPPLAKLPASIQTILESDTWRIIEATTIFWQQMKIAGDEASLKLLLAQYVIAVTGKSILSLVAKLWKRLTNCFSHIFKAFRTQGSDDDVNPFSFVKSILTSATMSMNHPILLHLRKIFHFLLSQCLLERFGISYDNLMYTKAEEEASQRQHSTSYGFVVAIVEGSITILERLYSVYKTKSWSPLLQNGEAYAKWAEKVYLIKEQAQMLHNPKLNGFTLFDFYSRMDTVLEEGDAILKYTMDMTPSAKSLVKKLLSEIRLIKSDVLTKKAARESRDAPFSILLSGGSSIGKSSLIDVIYFTYAKLHGLPIGADYVYTRTCTDEYYSALPTSAWLFILDDIAARNPEMKDDMSMNDIIQLINRVAFVPPQAELADKGRIPARPELVLATTNTKHLNASSYYCNPLAIARRFPLVVTAYPKAEYAFRDEHGKIPDEGFRMLDPSRAPEAQDGQPPDLWDFVLQKVVAKSDHGRQGPDYVCLHPEAPYVDIFYLLKTMGRMSKRHKANQKQVSAANDFCKNIEVCEECCCLTDRCECVPTIQGGKELSLALAGSAVAYGLYRYKKKKIRRWAVNTGADLLADVCVATAKKPFSFLLGKASNLKQAAACQLEQVRTICRTSKFTVNESLRFEKEKIVQFMFDLGQTAQSAYLASHPALLGLVLGVPVIVAGWKMYSHFFAATTQGNVTGRYEDVKDEKPNPWVNNDYRVSEMETGRLTRSWKGLTNEKVIDLVSRNTMFAQYRFTSPEGKKMINDIRIMCVGGNLYMTNHHNMPTNKHEKFDLTILQGCSGQNLSSQIYYTVYSKDMLVNAEKDLVFFRMRSLPPRSSMVDLFPSPTFKTIANGCIVSRDSMGNIDINQTRNVHCEKDYISSTTEEYSDVWAMKVARNTVSGECGSVCLAFSPSGPLIAGIHVKGGTFNTAWSMRVDRPDIEHALKYFSEVIIQGCGPNLEDPSGNLIPLGPLHHKSPFVFLETGNANVYGSFTGFRASHKSKVGDTFIRAAAEKRGCVVKTTAPMMKSYVPWRNAALDTVNQTFNVKEHVVDKCVNAYVKDILDNLSPEYLKELFVLDDDVTLNGQPGVQYIDKMKRNTSMGFPWRQKKEKFMTAPRAHDLWQDYVELPESFYKRTRNIEQSYRDGYRSMPIFTNHLKDEPVKIQKAVDGLTRVFSGAPADFAFVMRKYMLPFVRVVQKNRILFEAAPGVNTTSTQWDELYHYLTKFGVNQMIAGDFRKFDKKMSAIWIQAAFQILIKILQAAGWQEEDLAVIRGISVDVAFPLCDFNGDLVEFWGSNPSGHPLTVIINCLVNSLYMRYVWHEVGHDLAEFKKFVALITYGDDNTIGVHPEKSDFNHTSIRDMLAQIGVEYTMADKSAESIPFINIKDISFLKRGWRFEEEVGSFVAPLEEDSIFKMLTKNIPSTEVCAEQQGVDLCHSALREYWFYGRETFEQKRTMFEEIIQECGLEDFHSKPFTTFDLIKNEYVNNSIEVCAAV